MATNMLFKYSENKTRVIDLSAFVTNLQDTYSGSAVTNSQGDPGVGYWGVCLVDPGGQTRTHVPTPNEWVNPGTGYSLTMPTGGVGLDPGKVTIATDGVFILPVTASSGAIFKGAGIYIALDTWELTAASDPGNNILFGVVYDETTGKPTGTPGELYVAVEVRGI